MPERARIDYMAEKDVAAKLVKNSPRLLWKPLSDKYGYGTPDKLVKERGCSRAWVAELKHLKSLPIRSCKVGLKSRQAIFLNEWERDGGECYLIVGVGSDKVCVFDTGFIEICKYGVERGRFNLMNYNQVEEFLLYGNNQKTKH